MLNNNLPDLKSKDFFLIIAIIFAFVAPIILADTYYVDDWHRSAHAYGGWLENGRPLAEAINRIISLSIFQQDGDPKVVDTSPLPLLLSIFILGFSCMLVLDRVKKEFRTPRWAALAASLVIVCNPLFIQNLSYGFDILSMSVALAAVALVFFLDSKTGIHITTIRIALLACVFNTYQPIVSVFIVLSSLSFAIEATSNKNSYQAIKKLLINIFSLAMASAFYKATGAKFIQDTWTQDHISIIEISLEGVKTLIRNYELYGAMANKALNSELTPVFFALYLWSIYCSAKLSKNFYATSKKGIIDKFSASVIFLLPVLSLLLIPMPMALVEQPVVAARTMTGLGAFLCVIITLIGTGCPKIPAAFKYATYVPLVYSTIISYSAGNALKEQAQYDIWIAQEVVRHMQSTGDYNDIRIGFYGKIPWSPVANPLVRNFPIIRELVIRNMGDFEWLSKGVLAHMPVYPNLVTKQEITGMQSEICSKGMTDINVRYNLISYENYRIFDFTRLLCKP